MTEIATIYDKDNRMACLYSTRTRLCFGPVFIDEEDRTAQVIANDFLYWHIEEYGDPSIVKDEELKIRLTEFVDRCIDV